MRILILLKPTNVRGTKTAYTKFRKHLINDGFLMVAPELYMRVINNRKAVQKHKNRLMGNIPETGTITLLTLTEKQWKKIEYLTGEISIQEREIGSNCNIQL